MQTELREQAQMVADRQAQIDKLKTELEYETETGYKLKQDQANHMKLHRLETKAKEEENQSEMQKMQEQMAKAEKQHKRDVGEIESLKQEIQQLEETIATLEEGLAEDDESDDNLIESGVSEENPPADNQEKKLSAEPVTEASTGDQDPSSLEEKKQHLKEQ